jgi:hypothetical protein
MTDNPVPVAIAILSFLVGVSAQADERQNCHYNDDQTDQINDPVHGVASCLEGEFVTSRRAS